MENNYFSDDQLNNIFSDESFLIFASDYFSSFNTTNIESILDVLEGDFDEFWRLYIRIFLASVEEAIKSIRQIEKNYSVSYEEKKISVTGGIKGRLLINEYVQNKAMIRIPREYPCVVKNKGYDTPENEYMAAIIVSVVQKLHSLMKLYEANIGTKTTTEYKQLREVMNTFSSYLNKQPVTGLISIKGYRRVLLGLSNERWTELQHRFVKNKIKNANEYKRLFDWYERFKGNAIDWNSKNMLQMLVYDNDFRNKLFEIWNLHRIIEALKTEFDYEVIESNRLTAQMDTCVCKLYKKSMNQTITVYYQKGSGLYWDDDHSQNWSYINEGIMKPLRGIPDISLLIEGKSEAKIVLIDLKNRIRCKGENSEEIYKIIGYYSNFEEFLNTNYPLANQKMGVLVFRNDNNSFMESVVSTDGKRIYTIATSPGKDERLSLDPFILLGNITEKKEE